MSSLSSAMELSSKNPMWVYPKSSGLSPSQRWGHSACYFHGVVYIFGGCCGGMHFSDVLALNMTTMTWTTLATTGQGPGPRDSHSALVAGHKMIVFGGTDGSRKVNDIHMLDLLSKEWSMPICSGSPPTPRESHTCTLVGGDRVVVFGGSGEGEGCYLNDLYVLDLKSMRWSSPDVKGKIPVSRDSHGSVAIGSRIFVYGGDCGDRYNGDVDVLDTDSMTWSRLAVRGSSPGVRAGHAMVNIGAKVSVIGGVGDKCYYNDVWVLDVMNHAWSEVEVRGQKPQGRFSHTAVITGSDIAIYGGCGEDERPLDELLVLRLGAGHPLRQYDISSGKMFKSNWSGKRRFLRGVENNTDTTMLFGNKVEVTERKEVLEIDDLDSKPSIRYGLDMLHPKRRRTSNSKMLEFETEREGSAQFPQHSSSSHSDQEQNVRNPISDGFLIFKQRNTEQIEPTSISSPMKHIPRNSSFVEEQHRSQPRPQFVHAQQRVPEPSSPLNMVGSDVRGKVDAAFDSGYLMTAVVNGRIFRGVLFSPAPTIPFHRNLLPLAPLATASSIPVAVPIRYSNGFEPPTSSAISRHHMQPNHTSCRPSFLMSRTSSPPVADEALEGVVLTLGGPGSASKDS